MSVFFIVIHVIVSIALILIVLLQTGKGADMGAAFGGGSSQTLFGSSGSSTILSKATTVAAVIFMLTCLVLAYASSHEKTGVSIMKTTAPCPGGAARNPTGYRQCCTGGTGTAGENRLVYFFRWLPHVPKWWNLVDTLS